MALSIQVHKSYFIRIGINGINNVVMEWQLLLCGYNPVVDMCVCVYVKICGKIFTTDKYIAPIQKMSSLVSETYAISY